MLCEELHCFALLLCGQHFIHRTLLTLCLRVAVHAPDHGSDVSHIAIPLSDDLVVQLLQRAVVFALLVRPVHDVGHNAFEICNAVFTRPHGIVAQCLGWRRWVVLPAGPVAIRRVVRAREDPLVEGWLFCVGVVGAGNGSVSPANRVHVIRTDVGQETHALILGLRHVVEPRVVHDRGGCAHGARK